MPDSARSVESGSSRPRSQHRSLWGSSGAPRMTRTSHNPRDPWTQCGRVRQEDQRQPASCRWCQCPLDHPRHCHWGQCRWRFRQRQHSRVSSCSAWFNIPVALGKDIGAQATVNQTDGSSPTVDCIPAAAHQFTCHSTWSDGTPGQTMTATVSLGGTTWMTDSN